MIVPFVAKARLLRQKMAVFGQKTGKKTGFAVAVLSIG